jgi:riboflavin kinase/FMN adenylyltransferase
MKVHRDIHNLPVFRNAAITIGTFDGVHCGHVKIIEQLKKEAGQTGGESVIITFHPHPRMVIETSGKPRETLPPIRLLNTLSEKIELLGRQEIDHLVIVPFTLEFSNQSAEKYISDFLVAKFHPATIITGYDHRFGKNRSGDYRLLEKYQEKYGYVVKEIPAQVLDHIAISSTKIRHALSEGDIATARDCLGYDYFFEGRVIDGNKLGRSLGYPTANLLVTNPDKLIPAYGVYAVTLTLGSGTPGPEDSFIPESDYTGMMNIGIRPTIGDGKIMIEVHIFGFDKDIYGRMLRVYIKQYMRPEIRFGSLEELISQLDLDKTAAEKILHVSH